MGTERRFSFPAIPISFLALLLVGSGIYWWFTQRDNGGDRLPRDPLGADTLKVFRVPGGSLCTGGLTKTELFSKSDTNAWRGTTSSVIRLEATYRYDIHLRTDWRFLFDEERKIAFVVVPELKPLLPVAINTSSIQEETSSGWARFDKWELLEKLRKEVSSALEKKAESRDYIDLVRGEARQTVEEFVLDWILKQQGWFAADRPVVKVYFESEAGIPFPQGKSLSDFMP